MDDKTYLSIAYLGMIFAIAIWTWTIVSRSRTMEQRIIAMEESLNVDSKVVDSIASINDTDEE
jgi:hypothetical protein|tara:strand:- start:428 stop:616 length:189 start_codon:yes stop_codon:yes gene_type:complete